MKKISLFRDYILSLGRLKLNREMEIKYDERIFTETEGYFKLSSISCFIESFAKNKMEFSELNLKVKFIFNFRGFFFV